VLVNNAAVYAGLQRTSFESISEAEWDRVMSVNVKGTWIMTRAVAPLLRASGGGAIVNVSSATVMSGSPMWLHYVSSKGAIIAMTRALARELGDDNVTVNAIAPGLTLTDASLGLVDNAAEYGVMRGALKRAGGQRRHRRRRAVSGFTARDLRHGPDARGRWRPAVPLAFRPRRSPRRRFRRRRDAPDRVADVVGDQKRALLVEPARRRGGPAPRPCR
jgi:NAD(P)-dependent dehydrogenase (short-subunit alcohol dehydrogenase family)